MKKNQSTAQSVPQFPKVQSQYLRPPGNISPNQSFSTQFVTYVSEPKFEAKDFVCAEATERDILLFKEIFDFLDFNNNGVLQPMDLRRAFTQIGKYNMKKHLVYQIMSDYDQDQSGIIEFREFVKMMTMKPCEEDTKSDIMKVFAQIDQDYKGHITIDDLRELMDECKEELTDEQLTTIIRECDPEGNGVIRKEAFLKFMKRNKF